MLVIIRGLPGAGKTTLAKRILKNFNAVIINPDFLNTKNKEFVKFKNTFDKETRIKHIKYRYNLEKAKEALKKGKTVIWEQPWRRIENIKITSDNLNMEKDTRVIEIEATPQDVWNRCNRKFEGKEEFLEYCGKYKTYNLPFPILKIPFSLKNEEKTKNALAFLGV